MNKIIAISFLFICQVGSGQTRTYIAVGVMGGVPYIRGSGSYSWGENYRTAPTMPKIEFQIEKRIAGSVYTVTGLQLYSIKSVYDPNYISGATYGVGSSSYESQVTQVYAGLPLMLRLNVMNRNTLLMDWGFVPTFLLSSKLEETYLDTGDTATGNVAGDLSRLGAATNLAFTYCSGKMTIAINFQMPLVRPNYARLAESWSLGDNSLFLERDAQSFALLYGFSIGYRLK